MLGGGPGAARSCRGLRSCEQRGALMVIGGPSLAVWMHLWSQEVSASYPAKLDNEVTRGSSSAWLEALA